MPLGRHPTGVLPWCRDWNPKDVRGRFTLTRSKDSSKDKAAPNLLRKARAAIEQRVWAEHKQELLMLYGTDDWHRKVSKRISE